MWCTDIQRFAYVLAPGETQPPPEALEKWEKSKKGSRIALAAMKPGVRGYDVDKAQRDWMQRGGLGAGDVGHGPSGGLLGARRGPGLSGARRASRPRAGALRPLRPGQVFAFDGFFAWKLGDSGERRRSPSRRWPW